MTSWQTILAEHLRSAARPLVVVLGPTASGKTAFSIACCEAIAALAKAGGWLGAEVINADSRQCYRGLSIGTAKVTAAEARGVAHHLLDVLDPEERATIAWYRDHATAAIDALLAAKRVPVLVGGSMLYLSAVIDGLEPLPVADPSLRERLQHEYDAFGAAALHERLRLLDPEAAAAIEPRNKVYLVRALEIVEQTGEPVSAQRRTSGCPYDLLVFGMEWPPEILAERINTRTEALLRSGWVREVASLLQSGVRPEAPAMISHGYREIAAALLREAERQQSVIDDDAVLAAVEADAALCDAIAANTRRYAKRQRTWWRHDERIHWIRP